MSVWGCPSTTAIGSSPPTLTASMPITTFTKTASPKRCHWWLIPALAAVGEAFSTSPELTTNGMLRKAWRFVEDDGIYLYKGGTEGAANTGNEPYSEYYACQIADKMGIGCVQYDLENWKGILASKCRLFTDIDTSFVPIGRILRKTTLKACLDYYKTFGRRVLRTALQYAGFRCLDLQ